MTGTGEVRDRDAAEEREVKLAVADDFVVPELSALADVTVTDRGHDSLRAVYWDTDDLALARAGVGIRHRNGVWTYKGRSRREGDAVVRDEIECDAPAEVIPDALLACVAPWTDPVLLRPIAELDTVRHRVDLIAGAHSIELVHDRVRVLDGARTVSSFVEVEVEFAAPCQELADRVVALLIGAGAAVDPTPKYLRALRALGFNPPDLAV